MKYKNLIDSVILLFVSLALGVNSLIAQPRVVASFSSENIAEGFTDKPEESDINYQMDGDHLSDEPIRPYRNNPRYWQYKGEPVLLIGGSWEDNLFNHPEGMEEHLDLLQESGGNYIRNTMSSRNPGNPWAFYKRDDGLYDLDQFNDEYWNRLENLLRAAYERDIIVQIEVWDPWDYFRSEAAIGFGDGNVGWESCPFNPALNINYSSEETGLEEVVDYTLHTPNQHLFFQTPPSLQDIPEVRQYQEAFVEKMLSVSLQYPNVLYAIRNECREAKEWARYWARFIREKAKRNNREVFITDMRRPEDFNSPEQQDLLRDRTHFDFIEISQNNHHTGRDHYERVLDIRQWLEDDPVPTNNIKIYGGTADWTANVDEGIRRFWRNLFAGAASARFHREGPSEEFFGIGLNEKAQAQLKSARMLFCEFDIFSSKPSKNRLSESESEEIYFLSIHGEAYAVYFPGGGSARLQPENSGIEYSVRWLNTETSRFHEPETVTERDGIPLEAPGSGHWIALVQPDL